MTLGAFGLSAMATSLQSTYNLHELRSTTFRVIKIGTTQRMYQLITIKKFRYATMKKNVSSLASIQSSSETVDWAFKALYLNIWRMSKHIQDIKSRNKDGHKANLFKHSGKSNKKVQNQPRQACMKASFDYQHTSNFLQLTLCLRACKYKLLVTNSQTEFNELWTLAKHLGAWTSERWSSPCQGREKTTDRWGRKAECWKKTETWTAYSCVKGPITAKLKQTSNIYRLRDRKAY